MNKIQRLTVPAMVAAIVLSAASNPPAYGQQSKLEPVTLRMNWSFHGSYAPVYLGVSKGFFAAEGVDLKVLEGKGSATTANTVANGSDDFGWVDMGAVARLVDKGLPLKCVAQVRQKATMGVASLQQSGIRSPSDLKGKKVGYTPGDSLSLLFPAFAKKVGLDLNDVKREGLDTSVYLQALLGGQVDAILGYQDTEGFVLENRGAKITFIPYGDYGVNLVQNCLVTSHKMISEKPDLVRRVVRGLIKSYDYGTKHVDEAIAHSEQLFPTFDPKLARRQLEFLPPLLGDSIAQGKPIGWVDPKVWESTLKALNEYAGVTNTDPNFFYTNEFIPPSTP